MKNTVSVGELRQNPTGVLNSVQSGAHYTVTKHNQPIADIVPHRRSNGVRWNDVLRLLAGTQADLDWAQDIKQSRLEPTDDPWDG